MKSGKLTQKDLPAGDGYLESSTPGNSPPALLSLATTTTASADTQGTQLLLPACSCQQYFGVFLRSQEKVQDMPSTAQMWP